MAAPLITGLQADAQIETAQRRGVAYIVNGYDRGRKRYYRNGAWVTENLGLEPLRKTTDLTLSATGSGSMTGQYSGSITLFNGKEGALIESAPSPIVTVNPSSQQVKFEWDSSAFDAQVTHVRCYLTIAGAASEYDSMYLVGEADAADDVLTVNLTDPQIAAGNGLPLHQGAPVGNYAHCCIHQEQLVLANRARALKAEGAADSGSTTQLTDSALEDYATDYFRNMTLVLRPGAGDEETRDILAYTPATGKIEFDALTKTVSASDAYKIYERNSPTEVVWSSPGSPENFPPENAVAVDSEVLDEVRAVFSFYDHVIVCSRSRAVRVNTKLATWEALPLDCGCLSSRTVTWVGQSRVWLSDKGVIQLWPGYGKRLLTDGLRDDFTREVNPAVAHKACGCYHKDRYFLAFASIGNTRNDKLWFHDFLLSGFTKLPAWFERSYPFHVQALASVLDEDGIERLYAGCAGSDPGHKIKLLDIGLNDCANVLSSKNAGTVTGGSTVTVQDSTQTWTVNEFVGASVRVRRNGSSACADSVVQSNTSAQLTISPALPFTPVAGDTYEIGVFDSLLETAELDFGRPHEGKRLLWADVHQRDEEDAGSCLDVGAAADMEPEAFKTVAVGKDTPFERVHLPGRGKFFRLRLLDDSPDSPGLIRKIVAVAEQDRTHL